MRTSTPNLLLFLLLAGISFSCKKESAFVHPPKPISFIDGKTAAQNTIHLVKDTVYVLEINLVRDSGQSLVIDAGTLIKVNDLLSVTIQSGATIQASGNSNEPIVFTSSANTGRQGFNSNNGIWDGIRIYNNGSASSGILKYVRIEFAGLFTSSLLLNNVNNQTTLNNIQISYSFNRPSFELNGGNCNLSDLLSYASAGTDFLIENGYRGLMQNLIAYRHPLYAFQGTNLGGVYITDMTTIPTISNLTVIGPDSKHGLAANYPIGGSARRGALITTRDCKFHIRNSAFIDFPLHTFSLDDYNTADSINKGLSDLTYSVFYNTDSANIFYLKEGTYPPYISTDMRNFIMMPGFFNEIILIREDFLMNNPYNYYDGTPDPSPRSDSPLLNGADFSSSFYKDPFFKKVSYRGALGNDNWLSGWTNFTPLQTDYNNLR